MRPLDHDGQDSGPDSGDRESYVTAFIAGQLFGIPIGRVLDVFHLGDLTPVPQAPPDIRGLTNLRGRVITMLDIRCRLGAPPVPVQPGAMAIGIQAGEDPFGLLVDRIGEIVTVPPEAREDSPIHLDPCWAAMSRGVHQLDDGLLVLLDVDAALDVGPASSDTPRNPELPQ